MPFLERDGVRIWWNSTASGEPVLLLNGLSSPSDMWFRLVRQLSPGFQAITVDNRGTGRTGVTPGGPYSIETMASDAIAALDCAGVEHAHVLGISLGGMIAQEIALSFPDRTRSLVLAATHGGFRSALPLSDEVTARLAKAADLPAEERVRELAELFYASTTSRTEIDIDNEVRDTWPTPTEGYENQLHGAMSWGRFDDLPTLEVPALVLAGEADLVVPPENSRILAAAIPGARLALVPGAGHQIFTDQEHAAAALVIDFLRGVDDAVPPAARGVNPGARPERSPARRGRTPR
jgi:pimeloyl-ACP methyl ester carboxylesterase